MKASGLDRKARGIVAGASWLAVALATAGTPAHAQAAQEGAASPTPLAASATNTGSVALNQGGQASGASSDVIVVTGQRAAERAALETKRLATTIVDSLVANDVGKLPEQNIAEATRRAPSSARRRWINCASGARSPVRMRPTAPISPFPAAATAQPPPPAG